MGNLLCMIGIHKWKVAHNGIRVCKRCSMVNSDDLQKVADLKVI